MKLLKKFPANIKNIVFDFGGVIMDIDLNRTMNAFRKLGVSGLSLEDTQAGSGTFFDLHEQGKISSEVFWESLKKHFPPQTPLEEIESAWHALLATKFEPERIELIKQLRSSYHVFLLSNTNKPHHLHFCETFRKQFGYEFESIFEKTFFSDELGFVKPDPKIYDDVVRQTGIVPAETLFIDDNLKNTLGATACGWHAYQIHVGKESILDLFE